MKPIEVLGELLTAFCILSFILMLARILQLLYPNAF